MGFLHDILSLLVMGIFILVAASWLAELADKVPA